MKKAIATVMLLAGGLFAAPAVRVGIGIGVPAAVAVVRPACPGPGYTWVDGYYAPNGIVGWRLLGSSGCRDRRASLRPGAGHRTPLRSRPIRSFPPLNDLAPWPARYRTHGPCRIYFCDPCLGDDAPRNFPSPALGERRTIGLSSGDNCGTGELTRRTSARPRRLMTLLAAACGSERDRSGHPHVVQRQRYQPDARPPVAPFFSNVAMEAS